MDVRKRITTTTVGLEECKLQRPFKAAQGVVAGRWEGLVILTSARSQWDGDGESTWTELVFATFFCH